MATVTYARVVNGTVMELVTLTNQTPGQVFEASLAATFVAVPSTVTPAQGWAFNGGTFTAPAPPAITSQQAIAALINMLATQEASGVYFTPTGASTPILFATTPDAIAKYTAEWNAIGASPALRQDGDPMIAADGTPVALTNADAKTLIQKALTYFRACTSNYATLHAAATASPTTDLTVGWPSNS